MTRLRRAPGDPLERATERLSARLLTVSLLRVAPFALAGSLAAALTYAAVVGPTPSWAAYALGALLVVVPWPVAGVFASRELAGLRGSDAARALDEHSPWLASALRSALELRGDASAAKALVQKHRDSVVEGLSAVDYARVVPMRPASLRAGAAGLLLAFASAAIARFEPHVGTGLYALTHPLAVRDGARLALIVRAFDVRITPPAHRRGTPSDARSPTRLTVDEGARIDVDLTLRVDAIEADATFGPNRVRLERLGPRRFRGSVVARSSGPITLRARTSEGWLRDATARVVVVRDDAPPTVRVVTYSPESPIPPDAEIEIRFEASDDVGLAEVTRVVRAPSGVEQRTPLASPAAATTHVADVTRLLVAEMDLRPGDAIMVTIEARDDDGVDGPKTTRTEPITFMVDDGRDARERATADLRGLLDGAIVSLAMRLETEIPTDARALASRNDRLADDLDALRDRIEAIASAPAERGGLQSTDRGLLRGFQRRLGALATADRTAAPRGAEAVRHADEAALPVLEDAVLAFAELLGRVELEDAAAIARELGALQRELATLVRELRENPSEAARNAVRATMDRIRRRMGELATRLGSMQEELPAEFRNAAGASSAQANDALSDLERALAEDDLDAADRSVAALEAALRGMARSTSEANEEFEGTSRFGPRQRAFGDAFQRLTELENEQTALAGESARIRDGLSQRAIEALDGSAVQGLAPLAAEARRIEDTLRQLDRISRVPVDEQSLGRARARLDDAREALTHGDLGQASTMLEESTRALEAIASDLEFSRQMFDASNERIAGAADTARRAADALRTLDDRVTNAIPQLQQQIRETDQAALSANDARQSTAAESARSIAAVLEGTEHGEPLAPDVAQGIREAEAMMNQARDALGRRDTVETAAQQARAARRLRELRQQIEQEHSSSSSGGGGGGSSSHGGGQDESTGENRVDVPIPSGSEDAASRRRRVLDAMGDDVPDGYRGSVRRYYEELLR